MNILELGATSVTFIIFLFCLLTYCICYSIYYMICIQTKYLLYLLLLLCLAKISIYIYSKDKFYYDYGSFLFNIEKYNLAKKYLKKLNDENSIYKTAYIICNESNKDFAYNFILNKLENYEINKKINKLNKIAYELHELDNKNKDNRDNRILSEDTLFELSERLIKYVLELKEIKLDDTYNINGYALTLNNKNIAKLYYLLCISLNSSHSMTNYAILLKNDYNRDYKKIEYYLLKAIEMNNSSAMVVYADLMCFINYDIAIDYYVKAIKLNDNIALDKFLKLELDNYNKYKKLKNIESEQAKLGLKILLQDIEVKTELMKNK